MRSRSTLYLRAGDVLGIRLVPTEGGASIDFVDEVDDDEPPLIQATLSVAELAELHRLIGEVARG